MARPVRLRYPALIAIGELVRCGLPPDQGLPAHPEADAAVGLLGVDTGVVRGNEANRAPIMEGGRIRFSGQASELRDNPARLRSAYLLRGSSPSLPNEAGIPPRSASS